MPVASRRSAPAGSATIRRAMPTIYRMLADSDLAPKLGALACPVLVIGGSFDRTRPPATVEPVAHLIPGARYQLLETGHYMAAQTPELIATTIGDFLDEVGA